jgi:hypothetical protein
MMIQTRSNNPLPTIGCLLSGVAMMVGVFFVFKWAMQFVWWACLGFFIAALIIDWRVVADTGRWYLKLLQREPLRGLIYGVLGVVAFPLLSFIFFIMAIAKRRMKGMASKFAAEFQRMGGEGPNPFMQSDRGRGASAQDEYVDYEEIESKKKEG